MKKEAIDFNIEVKDAFGEVVTDRKETPLKLNQEVVSILNHPNSIPADKPLEVKDILLRLEIQRKVASTKPQVYSTDELSTIQVAVKTLVNNKGVGIGIAGLILDMTN